MKDIEALEARLAQSKAGLVALIRDIEAKPDDIDCAAHAQQVLSRLQSGELANPAMAAADVKMLGKMRRHRAVKVVRT